MPRVIHFEIGIDEPERAIHFYQSVFGWVIKRWEGPMAYWLVTTGPAGEPGIDGALTERRPSGDKTVNTIDVPDLDAYTAKVEEAGGRVLEPKQTIPGVGYFCYCQDSEGNVFGLMESDPGAK
jgi:predicted enzyme related to lactoylglutathione lyase